MTTTKTDLHTIAGALLAGALLLSAGCGGTEARKAKYIAKGQELMAEHDYAKARLEFRNALQIDPKDATARVLAGEAAEKLGNDVEAAQMYQAAIAADEKNIAARAHLGRQFVMVGLPDKALAVIEPGFAIAPEDPGLLTTRAAARLQRGELDTARKDADKAVALAPTNEDAVAVLSSLMRRTGQGSAAIALLQKTIKAVPETVKLRLALAQLLLDDGQVPAVEQLLMDIIRLEPDKLAHRYRLAQQYLAGKDVDGAEAALRDAVAANPDSVEARLALASLLVSQRSFEAADKELVAFRAKDPNNLPLLLGIGDFYAQQGQPAKAEALYREVMDKDGTDPQGLTARNRIAAAKLRAGEADGAAVLVEEVIAKNPRDADALVMRAELALAKGDTNAAITDLRAVLRDQPNSVPILRALSRAHLAANEAALAEEALRTAVQANPGDLPARLDLAQLLLQQGKPEAALPVIEQLVKAEPNNLAALDALYRVQAGAKEFDAALKTANAIQALQPKLPLGYYLAGLVAAAQQRPAEARAAFEQAASLDPKALDPVVALMQLDVADKQTQRAFTRLDEYLARQPDSAAAQTLKGELLLASDRPAEAAASFSAAVKSGADEWQPYRGQARAALAQGKTDAAIAAYKAGIAATKGAPPLVTDLASLYEQLGRIDDAIAEYEAMLARDPRNEVAANNLAMLLVSNKKDDASLDRASRLTARFAESSNPAFLDTYGWVLYARGEYAAAVPPLQAAVGKSPQAHVLRYHLGMAQLKSGQLDAARANLEAALKSNQNFTGADEARSALASLKK